MIITDLRMPRMDDMTFLHEVREMDTTTPIIVITAYAAAEITAESMESCAFDTGKDKELRTAFSPSESNAVQMAF